MNQYVLASDTTLTDENQFSQVGLRGASFFATGPFGKETEKRIARNSQKVQNINNRGSEPSIIEFMTFYETI